MGRPEKPIDPSRPAAPLAQFLRELRDRAHLSYGDLARAAQHGVSAPSTATLKRAASGEAVPKRPVVEAFARGCGATPKELDKAVSLWKRVRMAERGRLASLKAPIPTLVRDRADFSAALLHLYEEAGAPTLEQLRDKAGDAWGVPPSTSRRIIGRRTLPTGREQLVAFLKGCEVPENAHGPWLDAFARIQGEGAGRAGPERAMPPPTALRGPTGPHRNVPAAPAWTGRGGRVAIKQPEEFVDRALRIGLASITAEQARRNGVHASEINGSSLVHFARMSEEAGDRDGAERLARLAADAGHTDAYTNLARLSEGAGDFEEAERLARLAGEAGHPSALVRLARRHEAAGARDEAERLARLAADAGAPDALIDIARMREAAGLRDQARRLYRAAAAEGSTEAYLPLSALCERAGERQDAEAFARLAAGSGSAEALVRLARSRERVGDRADAERLAHVAAEAGHPAALTDLGLMRMWSGERGEAERLFRRAAAAGHPGAYVNLARMREEAGDAAEAERYARLAADAVPELGAAWAQPRNPRSGG